MKNSILFLCAICLAQAIGFSKPVSLDKAKLAAKNYLEVSSTKSATNKALSDDLTLSLINSNAKNEPIYYIFNKPQGFVIVSADDIAEPIIGFSDENAFDKDNIPPQLKTWLDNIAKQIDYAKSQTISASAKVSKKWNYFLQEDLANSKINKTEILSGTSKSPMLRTLWDQSSYPSYNKYCPYDASKQGYSVTGCVATSMAQIMNYNQWPNRGVGQSSYEHTSFGTLSADYSYYSYNWMFMPDYVTINSTQAEINAVAALMYLCGVSVEMNYAADGSGAQGSYVVQGALKNYFNYANSVQDIYEYYYPSSAEWTSTITNDLDSGRVVYYQGAGPDYAHAWVCDGYKNSNLLHFNWGWSGYCNGYFSVDSVVPNSSYTFNYNQSAVIGIVPNGERNISISFNKAMTVAQTNVKLDSAVDISIKFANTGSKDFSGDFCAALYDGSYNFIDYIECKNDYTLNAGATTETITFHKDSLMGVKPGTYYVSFFYKPNDENWQNVIKTSTISNFQAIKIKGFANNNTIKLKSNSTISSSIYANTTFSMTSYILNDGDSAYKGAIYANVFNENGAYVGKLDYLTSQSVPKNASDTLKIVFSKVKLNLSKGKYFIYLMSRGSAGDSSVVNPNTYYVNPIKINIIDTSKSADAFGTSSDNSLALSFPSDTANTTTIYYDNLTLDNSNDYDNYSINLPKGYKYTISGSVEDCFYGQNIYASTAIPVYFIYYGDYTSDSYIADQKSKFENIPGGTNVQLVVQPLFSTALGKYKINFTVKREAVNSVAESTTGNNDINVYPNPTSGITSVSTSGDNTLSSVALFDIKGSKLNANIVNGLSNTSINMTNYPSGEYILEIVSNGKTYHKNIVVVK